MHESLHAGQDWCLEWSTSKKKGENLVSMVYVMCVIVDETKLTKYLRYTNSLRSNIL